MYGKMKEFLAKELADIKAAGLYKNERIITTPQRADIKVNDGEDVLNFCANNYLGLSDALPTVMVLAGNTAGKLVILIIPLFFSPAAIKGVFPVVYVPSG